VTRKAASISAFCALWMMMCACSSGAQSRPLIDFRHTAWGLQDGAPSQIYALAQTKDGYLWLGTYNGLFRFDGVTFEEYQPLRGQHLLHSGIRSLLATSDGGLWIGYTLGDTSLLKNGTIEHHPFKGHVDRAGGCVYSILTRRDGSTWAATLNGPIKFVSGSWTDVGETAGTDIKSSYSLFEDSHRTLWMTTDTLVYRLPENATQFQKTGLSGDNTAITQSADGTVWVANETGIYDMTHALNPQIRPHPAIPFNDFVLDIRSDQFGALWVTAPRSGVTHISHPKAALGLAGKSQSPTVENFSLKDGLTSEQGLASLDDREGNMWVATADGLDRFRQEALRPAPLPSKFGFYALAPEADGSVLIGTEADGLQRLMNGQITKFPAGKESRVSCIYRAPDEKLWLGAGETLGYLDHGRFTAVALPPEVRTPARDTTALTLGPNGDLWMQTNSKLLGIFRLHQGKWSEVPGTRGKGPADVLTTSRDGRVWAGYYKVPSITIFDGDKSTKFTEEQGLTVGAVVALHELAEGMLIGGQHGLNLMKNDEIFALRFAGDLKVEGISGIARTEDGSIWINSLAGILRVPADEADQALKDPSHAMQYRLFNYLDGLAGKPPQVWPLPSVVQGVGTTLWFTTTNGVVSIDTAHIYTNPVPPPVSIKSLLVDGAA
jgi:ligand-binding sensor domain-containing protein